MTESIEQTQVDLAQLDGLQQMQAIVDGRLPPAPIAATLGMTRFEVLDRGSVAVELVPELRHYNPLGTVHGGIVTTVLDTAMGCAVQSELDAGVGYTTIELKTSFVRPVTLDSGRLRAEGRVVHGGSRIVTAEARLAAADGKLFAHATSTCLVLAGGVDERRESAYTERIVAA